jgi:hypothetical protein
MEVEVPAGRAVVGLIGVNVNVALCSGDSVAGIVALAGWMIGAGDGARLHPLRIRARSKNREHNRFCGHLGIACMLNLTEYKKQVLVPINYSSKKWGQSRVMFVSFF